METRSAGFWAIRPCSRWLEKQARSAESLRAVVLGASVPFGERRDVAAHVARADVLGVEASLARPTRELGEIDAIRAAGSRGRVTPAQVLL